MFNKAKQTEGLLNKLYVFIKGPGWSPGKPRLGDITDIPDVWIVFFFLTIISVLCVKIVLIPGHQYYHPISIFCNCDVSVS